MNEITVPFNTDISFRYWTIVAANLRGMSLSFKGMWLNSSITSITIPAAC